MHFRIRTLVVSLGLLGLNSMPALTYASQDTNVAMEKIASRTHELEQELMQLKQEMSALKSQMKEKAHTVALHKDTVSAQDKHAKLAYDSSHNVSVTQNSLAKEMQSLPLDMDVPGQSFVSSGPYIGIPLSYSGGNLIINSPNVNEDVSLLNIRKSVNARLASLGRAKAEDHAHLLLSGVVEGQALYKAPGGGAKTSDIDVTSAGLDGYILGPNSWTSGLISLAYDNDLGSNTGSYNNTSRMQNSRVFINKAFIVIGDFSKTPFYGSLGQMYVPFGTYSSNMVSSPITKILGRLKERALLVGYQQQGSPALYASAYVFKGDSYVGATRRINNGGINLGYRFAHGSISGDFGAGMIRNIADSQGMQNNGNGPAFAGFGGTNGSGNEKLTHGVPALNLRGMLALGSQVDFLAEYIGATTSFSRNDLTMNGRGAKPQAVNTEAAYTFTAFTKPSSLAIGYGRTKDGLAIGLPWQRYSLAFNTSLWENTLQSIEFRHDIEYAASSFASGSKVMALAQTGRADNGITAQFDMYF
jgi:hypothetical protein